MGKFMQEITGGYILSLIDPANARMIPHHLAIRFCQQEIHDKPRLMKALNQCGIDNHIPDSAFIAHQQHRFCR